MCWEQTDPNLLYKSRFFDPCIDFKWESFLWMEVGMFVIFNYWLALCMSVAVTVRHCVDAFLPRMQRGVWASESRWDAVLPMFSESIYYDRKSGAWGMTKYMVMQWWLSHTHWHVNTEINVLVSIHMLNIHTQIYIYIYIYIYEYNSYHDMATSFYPPAAAHPSVENLSLHLSALSEEM